jgi:general secretion pathway protein A
VYREHFSLRALPFENVPDPAFFFDRGDYHRVLQRMTDAVEAGRGLMAIAGPIGSGKTTLSQKLMADIPDSTKLIWMAEPPESAMELFLFLCQEFGVKEESATRVFLLRNIREALLKKLAAGGRCLMIVDESHLMSDDVLEGIRLLNNLEEGADKLIQIILLGQQELSDRLSQPDLEAFRQRIAGLEVISKMDPERLREYILHRITVAGGSPALFSDNALEAISISTGGVPRVTNSLCDRSLRLAYEEGVTTVDIGEVHKAAMDLGLGRKTMPYLLKLRAEEEEQKEEKGAAPETAPGEVNDGGERSSETAAIASAEPNSMSGAATDMPASPDRAPDPEREAAPPRPSLGPPLLLLASSLVALAGSFWFYCGRSAATFPGPCFGEIFGKFF